MGCLLLFWALRTKPLLIPHTEFCINYTWVLHRFFMIITYVNFLFTLYLWYLLFSSCFSPVRFASTGLFQMLCLDRSNAHHVFLKECARLSKKYRWCSYYWLVPLPHGMLVFLSWLFSCSTPNKKKNSALACILSLHFSETKRRRCANMRLILLLA